MYIQVTCNYCDHSWKAYLLTKDGVAALRCVICGDRDLRVRDPNDKVDTYQGCPPFPDEIGEDPYDSQYD